MKLPKEKFQRLEYDSGILYITVFVLATMIASFSLSQVYAEPIIYADDYTIEKFVTGLEFPTTMDFIGDDILVLEKNTGKVIRIQANGTPYNEPVLDVPVIFQSEAGLLGIVSVSDHVFLYFTESISNSDKYGIENSKNVVYQYDWDGERLINPVLIKELTTAKSHYHAGLASEGIDELIATESPDHHGGVMTQGRFGEFYFVIGDQNQHGIFQNIPVTTIYETSSIFKVDTENNNSVELYAMGIRNSFGLAVDPITWHLWDTENGLHNLDEVNLVKERFNSGWISVMGPATESQLSNLPIYENFVYSDPEFSWDKAIVPTAIAFPDKDSFRKYSDSLFVGDFNNGRIYKFQLNSDREGFVFSNPELSDLVLDDNDEIGEILFAENFQGITDIKFHNDAMYVVSIGDGSIYKIYPNEPLSPLKQYQNGVTHKKIVCKTELMPIMNKSGYIYCVQPKTALTLINVLNWSIDHPEMPKIELRFQDLSGLNFEYANLSNSDFRRANFDNAKLSNVDFTQANLSNADLSGVDLTGTILTGADLSGVILTGVDLSEIDLSGLELSAAKLIGVDLSEKDLTGTLLKEAKLSNANLSGIDLSNTDLTLAKLTGSDLSNANLTGAILESASLENVNIKNADFTSADLTFAKFKGTDISMGYLSTMNLRGANLSGAILTNADLSDKDLSNANLSGHDLLGHDMTNTILTGADLTGTILPDGFLSGKNLDHTVFNDMDLSGKDLSNSTFNDKQFSPSFINTNLENTNLSNARALEVDFTKIKNKSLDGADLTRASFAHSNLSGVSLSDVIMHGTQFWKADLSGQDFTVIDETSILPRYPGAVHFIDADLSNSNFEGVSLSPKKGYHNEFENKAHLYLDFSQAASQDEYDTAKNELFGEAAAIIILSTEVRGNDLAVNYVYFISFSGANLENANFKNADLRHVNFYSTNLTNADLSGAELLKAFLGMADLTNADLNGAILHGASLREADLTNADLTNADLTYADLSGAILTGANLENAVLTNAILNCVGHPICIS